MLNPAPRPPRQSFFEGPSTVFCVAVTACTVVINPSLIPKVSLITLKHEARISKNSFVYVRRGTCAANGLLQQYGGALRKHFNTAVQPGPHNNTDTVIREHVVVLSTEAKKEACSVYGYNDT